MKENDQIFHLLVNSPLFKGMKFLEIKNLFHFISFSKRQYNKNEIIAYKGDKCENLIILLKGNCRGEIVDYSGKVLKIEDIQPLKPLAPAFLFGQKNIYPVNIVANSDVITLSTSVKNLEKMMHKNTIFLKNFLDIVSSKAQFLLRKLSFLSLKTIKEKIAQFVLQNSKGKEKFKINNTQSELAELFGVARPSFSRVLSEMEKENIIKYEKKEITVLNQEKLALILEEV